MSLDTLSFTYIHPKFGTRPYHVTIITVIGQNGKYWLENGGDRHTCWFGDRVMPVPDFITGIKVVMDHLEFITKDEKYLLLEVNVGSVDEDLEFRSQDELKEYISRLITKLST